MMKAFAGKSVIITGSGRGIGRAMAFAFAEEGARLGIIDQDGERAEKTAADLVAAGHKAFGMAVDVTDEASVTDNFARFANWAGGVDVLVNNAGISNRQSVLDTPVEKWRRVLDVNLTGAFICARAAARLMIAQGKGGAIVNMSSVSGQRGGTGRCAYGASKAGIINLTQTLAIELAEKGIRVNAVAPGPTDTEMTNHDPEQRNAFLSRMMLKRYARPEEIAQVIVFIASDKASFVTGSVVNVDGGFGGAGMISDVASMSVAKG